VEAAAAKVLVELGSDLIEQRLFDERLMLPRIALVAVIDFSKMDPIP
jgi:hypothetical protein